MFIVLYCGRVAEKPSAATVQSTHSMLTDLIGFVCVFLVLFSCLLFHSFICLSFILSLLLSASLCLSLCAAASTRRVPCSVSARCRQASRCPSVTPSVRSSNSPSRRSTSACSAWFALCLCRSLCFRVFVVSVFISIFLFTHTHTQELVALPPSPGAPAVQLNVTAESGPGNLLGNLLWFALSLFALFCFLCSVLFHCVSAWFACVFIVVLSQPSGRSVRGRAVSAVIWRSH